MSLHHILQLAAPESLASYVTTCLRWNTHNLDRETAAKAALRPTTRAALERSLEGEQCAL